MLITNSFALDLVITCRENREQQVRNLRIEEIDFINIKNTTMCFC